MTARNRTVIAQFRVAQICLCRCHLTGNSERFPQRVIPSARNVFIRESYAQVATLVLPKSYCGLKPDGITTPIRTGNTKGSKRPAPLPIRLSDGQRAIIRSKARAAKVSVSRFVLAAALGSDYCPPLDPELTRALLRLN